MRFNIPLSLASVAWFSNLATAVPNPPPSRRLSLLPFLHLPFQFPDLPHPSTSSIDLSDIQADILLGMTKKVENFIFFGIKNPPLFKAVLRAAIDNGFITNAHQVLDSSTSVSSMFNVAFSQSGLNVLGVKDNLNDTVFSGGQFADAANLGDPGTGNWVPQFTGTSIHGVFMVASDSPAVVQSTINKVLSVGGLAVEMLYTLPAQLRPNDQAGHEHFGYLDGIGQPGLNGITAHPAPGQAMIDPGHILLGMTGDSNTRPSWAKGGSFMAFRQLKQLVPEFNHFLTQNAIRMPGLNQSEGAELLGARMIGRWKSGTPVDLAPIKDNPSIGSNPQLNNNFDYSHPGANISTDQSHCPFSAHTRKTVPRADLSPMDVNHHIIRAGIPYGPEVSVQENASGQTNQERGLAFVAYQSNLAQGFQFLQQKWANNPKFVPRKNISPGFDPIIGANAGQSRLVAGLDSANTNKNITMVVDFVQSKGGEYFFVPSLSALKNVIGK